MVVDWKEERVSEDERGRKKKGGRMRGILQVYEACGPVLVLKENAPTNSGRAWQIR